MKNNFKLYHGNCVEVLQWLDLSNAIIVSDPPFNVGYHYNEYRDKLDGDEYFTMLADIFSRAPSVVIHYPEQLYKLAFEMGDFPEKIVSWCYNANTPRQHRDIAFFRVVPDFRKVSQPYKNPNDKRIKKLIESGKKGGRLYDWWEIPQVKNVSHQKTKHPCQMPLEVMKRIIGILPEGKTIIDPFMGSGTTGVACQEIGRDFVGIEMSREYFEIARERIEGEFRLTNTK